MNRKGVIVYSYEDLKKLIPSTGKKGLWCFQANFHDGHKKCAELAQHCDCVVGILFNNRDIEERWMTGSTNYPHYPLTESDINYLKKYSDIGFIITGEYSPHKEHWENIQKEIDENFPIECLKEKGILDDRDAYNGLIHGIAFRYILHGVYGIYFDYQAQGGKDRFRVVGYSDYVKDRWGIELDIIDSVRNNYGNSISRTIDGLPKELKDRININLLKPEFSNIDQVKEHIKNIEGLKVINFYKIRGWIYATFSFDGYKEWSEGIRCK